MDQKDSYGYERKLSGGWLDPDLLTIVGLDCEDSERPELADPDPIRKSIDDLVPSVAAHGVREAITIRKYHGDARVFVVTGRRRVRAAREVNAKLADDHKILIKCIPEPKGTDSLMSLVLENEHRVNDSVLARARKASRIRQRGGTTDAEIARVFGVTSAAIRSWWALLESPPAVQTAVEEGRITATVGAEIAKVEPSKQPEALEAAIAAGRGSEAQEAVRLLRRPHKGADGEDRPQRIGVATLKRFATTLDDVLAAMEEDERQNINGDAAEVSVIRAVIRAILGEGPRALKDYPNVQKALRAAIKGDAA